MHSLKHCMCCIRKYGCKVLYVARSGLPVNKFGFCQTLQSTKVTHSHINVQRWKSFFFLCSISSGKQDSRLFEVLKNASWCNTIKGLIEVIQLYFKYPERELTSIMRGNSIIAKCYYVVYSDYIVWFMDVALEMINQCHDPNLKEQLSMVIPKPSQK